MEGSAFTTLAAMFFASTPLDLHAFGSVFVILTVLKVEYLDVLILPEDPDTAPILTMPAACVLT
jgi:hypothetical protein